MATQPLRIISSMATRQVLTELLEAYHRAAPQQPVRFESVGGVDAARRVRAGEAFDAVVLASDAIEQLIGEGHLRAGSRVDLVHSGVSVAVRTGSPRPDLGSEDAVREAVLAAPSLGYSTGPSGVELLKLFDRWGITAQIKNRLRQAPPGVPVGQMVAQGDVALGFQQLSELIHVPGIDVAGPLPQAIRIDTTFSAAVATLSPQPEAVRTLLAFLASPATAEAKRRNGLAPA